MIRIYVVTLEPVTDREFQVERHNHCGPCRAGTARPFNSALKTHSLARLQGCKTVVIITIDIEDYTL